MEKDLLVLLKGIKPFHLLSNEILDEAIALSTLKEYEKNKTIIHQGDKENFIFIIVDGIATNVVMNDVFEEITIKTYNTGELFGLIHAMSGGGFMYSIRAVSNVTCILIPIDVFEKIMTQDVNFTEEVARLITVRLREMYQKIGIETSYPLQNSKVHAKRRKIVELMSHPIITIDKNTPLLEAANKMLHHRISSLVVVEKHEAIGMITKKDLLRAFINKAKRPLSIEAITAQQIMSSNVITIDSQAYSYEAIIRMLKHNIKHLPVVDHNKLIGMVTTRNLFDSFSDSALYLVKEIDNKKTIDELQISIKKIEDVYLTMMEEHATAKEICSVISEVNDRVTQKIIHLAEEKMIVEGFGSPPVPYCWISLGSEGRKEQTLQTDQDNAIIFSDVPKEQYEQVDQYFSKLAEKVISALTKCGFPECPGNVMATNRQWRNTVSGWKKLLDKWIDGNEPELIRLFTIFVDFRPIYGDKSLADELRERMIKKSNKNALFLHLMAEDDTATKVAINRLGLFQLEKGEPHGIIDLKYGGINHIINGLRILAVKYDIVEVNSWERLDVLYLRKIINEDERDQILQALDDLMVLRLQSNLKKLNEGQKPDHVIHPNSLSKKDRIRLKKALMTTRWFQMLVIRESAIPGTYLRGF